MREPPPHLTDEDVLAAVDNEHWAADADRIGHLPVGFGAHHWRASGARGSCSSRLDDLGGSRRARASLEAAWRQGQALADAGLEADPGTIGRDGR